MSTPVSAGSDASLPHRPVRGRRLARLALGVAAALSLAACGDDPVTGNQAPVFSANTAPLVAVPCSELTASFEAVDPEGGTVTYVSPNLPAGAAFVTEGTTAVLTWTPTSSQPGQYSIVVYAIDDGTPAMTGRLVYEVEVTAPPAATVNFDDRGTSTAASLVAGDLTVTGSADLYFLNLNGLGVVGGVSDATIDGAEWVDYAFATATTHVSYHVVSSGNLNGNGTVGDAFIEAFDGAGASLGVVPTNGAGPVIDVSGLFADATISRVRVTADVDNHRPASITFDGCAQ